jgi:uncharacterized protein
MIFSRAKSGNWQVGEPPNQNRFRYSARSVSRRAPWMNSLPRCSCLYGIALEETRCIRHGPLSCNLPESLPVNKGVCGTILFVDNYKITLESMELGKGIIALEPIMKNEVIAAFDGEIYPARRASELFPKDIRDHAIQIGPNKWRDSNGVARFVNHSCDPNLGYRGLNTLVAMRDIEAGERLTSDYEMTERSDWRMRCLCGTPSCRGVIGTYDNMPEEVKRRYGNYISEWLRCNWRAAA